MITKNENNIQIYKDFLYVSHQGERLNFDECRIYDNFYIEFYNKNNLMMEIEARNIKIEKVRDIHYYISLNYEGHFTNKCIYLKLKEEDISYSYKIASIGDIVFRKNFNTIKNKYPTSYPSQEVLPDATILFYLSIEKELNKLPDDEIIKSVGWKVIELINERVVKIKHNNIECLELIRNLETLDNIKKSAKEFINFSVK